MKKKCTAKTLKGTRCKRNPLKGNEKCCLHSKKRQKKAKSKKVKKRGRKSKKSLKKWSRYRQNCLWSSEESTPEETTLARYNPCTCDSEEFSPALYRRNPYRRYNPQVWEMAKKAAAGTAKLAGKAAVGTMQLAKKAAVGTKKWYDEKGRDMAIAAGQKTKEMAIKAKRGAERWYDESGREILITAGEKSKALAKKAAAETARLAVKAGEKSKEWLESQGEPVPARYYRNLARYNPCTCEDVCSDCGCSSRRRNPGRHWRRRAQYRYY